MQHSYFSQKLTLTHAFLRLSIRDPTYLQEALTMFELSMKTLLSTNGRVLHTKIFKQTDPGNGQVTQCQIRCYFAYSPEAQGQGQGQGQVSVKKTQEQWATYLQEILGEHIEGEPCFIQMQPFGMMQKRDQAEEEEKQIV